ncbi:MAG TPA: MaoC family dehydratase, partial [Vicinamibacterales bacterium]
LVFHVVFGKTVPDISLNAVANLGYAEGQFLKPVYPGDTLNVRGKIIETRPSQSKPHLGSFRTETTVTNQDDVPVMRFTSIVLIQRRPSQA